MTSTSTSSSTRSPSLSEISHFRTEKEVFGFKKFGETHFDPFQHYDRTLDPPSRSFVDSICFVAKRNSLVWKIWRENLNLNTARESFKNRQKLLFCDLKGSLFDIFSQRKIKFGQAQKSGWGSIDWIHEWSKSGTLKNVYKKSYI